MVVSAKETPAPWRGRGINIYWLVALNLILWGEEGGKDRKIGLGPLSVDLVPKTQNCESIWAGTL